MSERKKLLRFADFLVEDILETTPEEILAEFEEDYGGADKHVEKMRSLIKEAVKKANQQSQAEGTGTP